MDHAAEKSLLSVNDESEQTLTHTQAEALTQAQAHTQAHDVNGDQATFPSTSGASSSDGVELATVRLSEEEQLKKDSMVSALLTAARSDILCAE